MEQMAIPMENQLSMRSPRATRAVAIGAPWSCMRGGYHFSRAVARQYGRRDAHKTKSQRSLW